MTGLIWALPVSEGLVLVAGVVMRLLTRDTIARGLSHGNAEKAYAVV
ncbi:hypothetical protein HQO24_21110 [Rhodococcus fascians]|nr:MULTISPECIES: hypothetical protein [Rhodococcus]MBY4383785.1 hypothetical protein [Rhodococcus fascians]MBY4398996.1 hypothetical protein [Rhodococcus fascians]MBY4408534.1 hypothetical protein [Rhodococcus fascians]MBY4423573.1 hypothetical protein [Rhodococcus fascians]MBY4462903.1 hypothetical protein [Rhodococcus fascians]